MNPDEQQIRALVAEWMAATQRGDIAAVLELMAEDVVFLVPGRPPMVGRAAFEAAAQAQALSAESRPRLEGQSEIQEIEIVGDWAFMWTRLKVAVTPHGAPTVHRAGHTLSILKKQEGKWLLARDANLLVAEP